jgi:hypothetical protein
MPWSPVFVVKVLTFLAEDPAMMDSLGVLGGMVSVQSSLL